MYHYILVRVEEPEESHKNNTSATKASLVRKAIHAAAEKFQISVADNLIRQDRTKFIDGQPVPYAETEELFKKIMPKEHK